MRLRLVVIATIMAALATLFFANVGSANAATPQQANVYLYWGQVWKHGQPINKFETQAYYYDSATQSVEPCGKTACGAIVTSKHYLRVVLRSGEQVLASQSGYGYSSKTAFYQKNVYNGHKLHRTIRLRGERMHLATVAVGIYNPKFGTPPSPIMSK